MPNVKAALVGKLNKQDEMLNAEAKRLLGEADRFLAPALAATEEKIANLLGGDTPFIAELLRYAAGTGGKRFRPRLTLLSAATVGAACEGVADVAACIECVHLATLIHDDVVDEATNRRGRPTAARRFGNRLSILAGDYIITRVFQHLAQEVKDWNIQNAFVTATNKMVAGEFLQMWRQGRLDVAEDEYFRIIGLKSAELMSASCRVGVIAGDCNGGVLKALGEYGTNAGMSFQITDDWLDYSADAAALGKEEYADVRSGKITLPLIYGLNLGRAADVAATVEAIWEGEPVEESLNRLLVECGAMEKTRDVARTYAERGKDALASVPPGDARDMLAAMADWTWQRRY